MTHRVFGLDTVKFEFEELVMDIIVTSWCNICNSSFAFGGHHDWMFCEETILIDEAKDVSLGEEITLFDFSWVEAPLFFRI